MRFFAMTTALQEGRGPQRFGSVGPKRATVGVFVAKAMCMGPVSFVIKHDANGKTAAKSLKERFPAIERAPGISFLMVL